MLRVVKAICIIYVIYLCVIILIQYSNLQTIFCCVVFLEHIVFIKLFPQFFLFVFFFFFSENTSEIKPHFTIELFYEIYCPQREKIYL